MLWLNLHLLLVLQNLMRALTLISYFYEGCTWENYLIFLFVNLEFKSRKICEH